MKSGLRVFFAGFLSSLLLIFGLGFWHLSNPSATVTLAPSKLRVGATPQELALKVEVLLPNRPQILAPPASWSFGLKGEIHSDGQVYNVVGGVGRLGSGPPYEIKSAFNRWEVLRLLKSKADSFDFRLVVSLCEDPEKGCERPGKASMTALAWMKLSRAQLMGNDIDLGKRMVHYVVAKGDDEVACPGGVLSGTVDAGSAMQPLLAATKQVLVLVPLGVVMLSDPRESSRLWMKELSFQGSKANFSAELEKQKGVLTGAYSAQMAFCKKGVSDLECVKFSGLWDAKLRSYPFGNRRYLQLATKDFVPLACGTPPATLLMQTLEEKDLNASFDALPASIPEEIRAAPWGGYCPGCVLLVKWLCRGSTC